jgi:hypothetical protein
VHREPLRQSLERMVTDERFLFAARNDGTKAFLEEILGRTTDRIREIPDVAVFVPTEDVHHPEIDPDRTNLIVAPNAEDEPERWGRSRRQRALRRPLRDQGLRGLVPVTSSWGWAERRNEFVGALAGALGRIAADRPTNVILCAHDPADVGMCWDIYSRLPEAARFDVSFTAASLPVSAGRRFYDLYRKADAAISMRIHSMNPAVGLGTPVVPLVSQRRMSAFMQDAGLTELTVDLHGGDIERRIHAATQRALDDGDAVRTRLRGAVDRLRDEVRAVNADIDAFLR